STPPPNPPPRPPRGDPQPDTNHPTHRRTTQGPLRPLAAISPPAVRRCHRLRLALDAPVQNPADNQRVLTDFDVLLRLALDPGQCRVQHWAATLCQPVV